MPVTLIDKALVRHRFCRSQQSYDEHASVQREAAQRLGTLLADVVGVGADIGRVLELGCGTGVFTRELLERFRMQRWVGNDIVCTFASLVDEVCAAGVSKADFIHADMETCEFEAGWNVVAANASFQWLRDSVRFATRLLQLLEPEGMLVFSTFGPDNMIEISELTGSGLRYAGYDQMRSALSEHCTVLASEDYHQCMMFDDPRDVLRHIKATGTNAVTRSRWSKQDLRYFSEQYRERFGTVDGRVRLTYHPMLFVARMEEKVAQ
ncbi:MAG: malonyl-ACP O-methyltransferase BioC [Kiritimatiellae bacterium]|nr:malonyl-ACP O-methyltransferase BioC [Kiritimatiellia bacterium]